MQVENSYKTDQSLHKEQALFPGANDDSYYMQDNSYNDNDFIMR